MIENVLDQAYEHLTKANVLLGFTSALQFGWQVMYCTRTCFRLHGCASAQDLPTPTMYSLSEPRSKCTRTCVGCMRPRLHCMLSFLEYAPVPTPTHVWRELAETVKHGERFSCSTGRHASMCSCAVLPKSTEQEAHLRRERFSCAQVCTGSTQLSQ